MGGRRWEDRFYEKWQLMELRSLGYKICLRTKSGKRLSKKWTPANYADGKIPYPFQGRGISINYLDWSKTRGHKFTTRTFVPYRWDCKHRLVYLRSET